MPRVEKNNRGEFMHRQLNVVLNGIPTKINAGLSILEALDQYPHPGKHPALGAIVDFQLSSLGRRLRTDCTVDTVDLTSKAGADIYRRTVVLLLTMAVEKLLPGRQIEVGQSIAHGYFFSLRDGRLGKKKVKELQAEMERLRDRAMPLHFMFYLAEEAIRYYESLGLKSKADMLWQSHQTQVLMAKVGDRLTLPYGPLAMSTDAVHHFSLLPYEDGMVLRFPDRKGRPVKRMTPQPKLFATFRESAEWNKLIGAANVSQLNRLLIDGRGGDLIRLAEGLHEKKIVQVADLIAARRNDVRLILISGPSSSGKTTTSKRLSIQLRVNGIEPVTVSLDNYYLDPDRTPRHPDGSFDFEHLEALDLKLLDDHLPRLIAGEKVATPVFDFQNHRRHPTKTIPIQLAKNQVLMLEGIHALNPRLTENVRQSAKFKLFVSALTQLSIDEHNRIFTADTRLLRRLVRDRHFRGYAVADTINMWDSVRKGEQKWIFPFQEDADVLFNSALVYEQSVLTTYARRFLVEVPRGSAAYTEADRLMNFVNMFIPILPEEVPTTSVLREFIGGSAFRY